MKRVIELGKIDYYENGRKTNLVTVEVELKNNRENNLCFSVCGNVWNNRKTDILQGGQCLDSLLPYFKHNELFLEIYRLWKEYHLNDMHSGTPEQEQFLKDNNIKGWANDYYNVCDILKENNLYEVEHNGKPYRFGTGWLYQEIPNEDLDLIEQIIEYGRL